MCSSPKGNHHSYQGGITLRPTQLSAQQQADFTAKANAAWERNQLRRQQRKTQAQSSTDLINATTASQPKVTITLLGLFQQLWHKRSKHPTKPAAEHHE